MASSSKATDMRAYRGLKGVRWQALFDAGAQNIKNIAMAAWKNHPLTE